MNTFITLSFLLSTYFIKNRMNSLIYKDIVITLDDMNLKIKEEEIGEIADIVADYTGTFFYDRVLQYLSILPIFNVIYATHNAVIYSKEKDIIMDEILESDVLVKNDNYYQKQYIDNNEAKNNYMINDERPKMMIKKKSK